MLPLTHPTHSRATLKELPKDSFTKLFKFVIIIVSRKKPFILYSIYYNVIELEKICQIIKLLKT